MTSPFVRRLRIFDSPSAPFPLTLDLLFFPEEHAMKPAMCRLTLLSLLLLTLSGGCTRSPPGMANHSGKTPKSVGKSPFFFNGRISPSRTNPNP